MRTHVEAANLVGRYLWWIIPKINHCYYLKTSFLGQCIQKVSNLKLKAEALVAVQGTRTHVEAANLVGRYLWWITPKINY